MKVIEINAKDLNETNFKKYGTAILKPTDSAPKIGKKLLVGYFNCYS